MSAFVRKTWFVTALFVAPILGLELLNWRGTGYPEGMLIPGFATLPAIALLVTPSIWWWMVARNRAAGLGRGAAAGALSAAGILLPPTLYIVTAVQKRGFGQGEWGLLDLYGVAFTTGTWILGIPLGAGLGMLTVALQGGGWRRQHA